MFLWGKRWSALPPPEPKPGGQFSAPPAASSPLASPLSSDSTDSLTWLTLSFLHNISTPLSTLATVLEDLSPSLPESANQVLQATLQSLIQTTHLHSDSLRGNVAKQPVDLVLISQRLTPLLKQICHPYSLKIDCHTSCLFLVGDSAAWEQILINLTLNSREALREQHQTNGSIWLTLAKQKQFCLITWKDSGVGIKPETWRKIQQPLTGNWKKDPHGYGLRSCRYWWEKAFQGQISLQTQPNWCLILQARLAAPE
jgi:C4-dicarboxylate-specific signal transduction histidine kinase